LLEAVNPRSKKLSLASRFSQDYVKRLQGPNVKSGKNKMELAEQVMDDIEQFRKKNNLARLVMVWCGSTEVYMKTEAAHASLSAFRKGASRETIPRSREHGLRLRGLCKRIPFANGAPNLTVDIPALTQLAQEKGVLSAERISRRPDTDENHHRARIEVAYAGPEWMFSTNILGNRDGEVLDDPESFKTKEESKLSVLDQILQPSSNPDLYKVSRTRCGSTTIRREETIKKDGTTSTSTDGSVIHADQNQFSLPRQYSCRAARAGPGPLSGPRTTLRNARHPGMAEFLLQEPDACRRPVPEHDLFIQLMKLKNTLRY